MSHPPAARASCDDCKKCSASPAPSTFPRLGQALGRVPGAARRRRTPPCAAHPRGGEDGRDRRLGGDVSRAERAAARRLSAQDPCLHVSNNDENVESPDAFARLPRGRRACFLRVSRVSRARGPRGGRFRRVRARERGPRLEVPRLPRLLLWVLLFRDPGADFFQQANPLATRPPRAPPRARARGGRARRFRGGRVVRRARVLPLRRDPGELHAHRRDHLRDPAAGRVSAARGGAPPGRPVPLRQGAPVAGGRADGIPLLQPRTDSTRLQGDLPRARAVPGGARRARLAHGRDRALRALRRAGREAVRLLGAGELPGPSAARGHGRGPCGAAHRARARRNRRQRLRPDAGRARRERRGSRIRRPVADGGRDARLVLRGESARAGGGAVRPRRAVGDARKAPAAAAGVFRGGGSAG